MKEISYYSLSTKIHFQSFCEIIFLRKTIILKKPLLKKNNSKLNIIYGKCPLYVSLNKEAKLTFETDNNFSVFMKFLDCMDLNVIN